MSLADSDLKSIQDAIYREKVERARKMPALEKFLAGEELFQVGCEQMLGNIRTQMPDATDDERRAELRRRLAIGRQIEQSQLKKTFAG